MTAPKALILGGLSWNTIVHVRSLPRQGDATSFADAAYDIMGGTGAGKAANLARLGWSPRLWAAVGDDDAGRCARAELSQHDVELVGLVDRAGTERHLNLMTPGGGRNSIYLQASSSEVSFDPELLKDHLETADLVALNILAHCRSFIPVSAASNKPIWVDLHDWDATNAHHLPFVDAATHLQLSSDRLDRWRDLGSELIGAGKQMVVVTHGSAGASAIDKNLEWHDVEARSAELVDSNGAGDAFFAGFTTALFGGAPIDTALEAGAVSAAETVEAVGLAPAAGRASSKRA